MRNIHSAIFAPSLGSLVTDASNEPRCVDETNINDFEVLDPHMYKRIHEKNKAKREAPDPELTDDEIRAISERIIKEALSAWR